MEQIEIGSKDAGNTRDLSIGGTLILVIFVLTFVDSSGGAFFLLAAVSVPFGLKLWSYFTTDLLTITLSEQGVKIGSSLYFDWNQIHSYKIYTEETIDGISHYLSIETTDTDSFKYNIGFIELSVEEIEPLFHRYSQQKK